jgi:hypothetical protein
MAKDLCGGKSIEIRCCICGKLFPEFNNGTAQLYCTHECRTVAHNRHRRQKWQTRHDMRAEVAKKRTDEIKKYTDSLGARQLNTSIKFPSVDLFGTDYNPKGAPSRELERRFRKIERNRPENIKTRDEYRRLRREYRPEYHSWVAMRNRVLHKSHEWCHRYGGRGITICERWLNGFENFVADMGRKPDPKYTLDRIDNDGNYEPGNCKWASASEQRSNQERPKYYNKISL